MPLLRTVRLKKVLTLSTLLPVIPISRILVVKIGTKSFKKLFTSGDKAWAVSDRVDRELVEGMKRGERMIVTGTSAKGTDTKDTYSLAGFSSAYKAISAKCGKK